MAAYDHYEFHVVYQQVSQFAAVELSAIYHDLVKDRLYTDAAHSPRRRSTQTALYRMVTRLCQMLGPVLAFTADEAWEFIPARAEHSVHLSVWKPAPFTRPKEEEEIWTLLFQMRELALPELEKARQAKSIGKALEAKILLRVPAEHAKVYEQNRESFRELLNVSQLELAELPANQPAQVVVTKADGQKCERCWHWETDIGSHPGHPTICGRCVAAVESKAAAA
jgi:isoleucyl-tRNA synthetase